MVKKVVFLGKDVIAENERLAQKLRELYDKYGVTVYEFLGGPGSGKTSIIERLIPVMRRDYPAERMLYVGGDVATTLDTERIARLGVRTIQINTGGTCHLEVPHVEAAIKQLGGEKALEEIDVMIIENVGNLICPFNFPLGAHARIMVVSVAEGEDKFVKHPISTKVSDIIVINKIDLAKAVGVNIENMVRSAREINPKAPIVLASARTGEGIEELYRVMKEYVSRNK
ncbi:hydrogenase nickel incorporation protein HypB [Pyrofollis japonicus]|uniref:hydrogenase nickel incorporation protein HypB n=1 Tax=Pyrofollis japonicus TaxID=3060460 RepID=UPI00295BB341|nr:hydrogenase nickel incorporation protein HypB [Pyrofollis japonicus]BEP18436.1 hydrogenase nickel incorporation protein HypB [Pyrofollis japonicus]